MVSGTFSGISPNGPSAASGTSGRSSRSGASHTSGRISGGLSMTSLSGGNSGGTTMDCELGGEPLRETSTPPRRDSLSGMSFGRYRALRKLGEGGMGTVYLVEHEQLERRAAVKVLHPRFAKNPELARRFLSEARAISRVQHPGVVGIFEFGELPDRTQFFLMEYLPGETLGRRMRTRKTLAAPELLRLIQQVARTLSAVHGHGIVHRVRSPPTEKSALSIRSARR